MLILLLVPMVLELFLANGLLDLFRGQSGQNGPLILTASLRVVASMVAAGRLALARLRRRLRSAHRAYGPALAVALVPLRVALAPLRVALAAGVARLVLALLSAAPLRFGLGAVVARADFVARDDLLLDLFPDEPLDVAQVRAVFARDERHGLTGFSRAAGAADAVDVVFRDVRHVVVHHVRQRLDVEAARGDVGSDQHLQLAVLEALQRLHALRL